MLIFVQKLLTYVIAITVKMEPPVFQVEIIIYASVKKVMMGSIVQTVSTYIKP